MYTDQSDAVLRIAPPPVGMIFYERHMMAQEPEIHALLRAEIGVPVAEIYAHDDSHALIERSYMLMERLPGRALWGDPEIEYALLDHCGISDPASWRGYGAARDESPAAQVRQRF